MIINRWLATLLVIGLAACAAPQAQKVSQVSERVILLPSESGVGTSVVVTTRTGAVELSKPYAVAGIRRNGIEQSSTTAEEVKGRYGVLIAAQPRKPKTFTVFFMFDSDEFTVESKIAFDQVLTEVANWPGAEVVVTGHTDSVGTDEYNDALSLKRAATVAKRLIAAGIPAERVSVAGRGEREPLVPTRDEAPEPRNRRVDLKVR